MRLPDDSQGILICGRRGSGKTHEALHHLSQRSFDRIPWVCLDFKGDDLLSQIPVSAPYALGAPLPAEPGLYVARAAFEDHGRGGPVEDFLVAAVQRGNIGIFIDEGVAVGQYNKGLHLLLTAGRSKNCPLVMLTQSPFYIDPWAFRLCEFIQVFYMQQIDDQARIHQYISRDRLDFAQLRDIGPYHSAYWDVLADKLEFLQPCPALPAIYDRILTRLPRISDPPAPMPAVRARV